MFAVMLAWLAILAVDGHLPNIGAIDTLMVWLTVAAYPLLVFSTARLLRPSARFRAWPPRDVRILRWAPVLAIALSLGWMARLPLFAAPNAPIQDDVTPSIICAAQDTLRADNPYATNVTACLARLDARASLATPLQRGAFADLRDYPSPAQLAAAASTATGPIEAQTFPSFGYPPLSFLLMLPVAFAGHTAWVLWTVLLALLWLIAMVRLAPARKSAVLALLLLQLGAGSVIAAATQGDAEMAAFALAALGLACYDRTRCSSVLMAAAASINLLMLIPLLGSWLLAAHTGELRRRFLWSVGTLLACIGPWLLIDAGSAQAMLNLVTQPVFNFGDGLVAIFGPGQISPVWHPIFLGTFVALFALTGWLTWRHRAWAYTAPALLLAVLWISWRSDANYLAQPLLLAVAMIIGMERLRRRGASTTLPPPAGRGLGPNIPVPVL
jgi:hypothetical protein